MSTPTQKALIIASPSTAHLTTTHPHPRLRDSYLLVKTHSIALNPSDWKHLHHLPTPSSLLGCDFSGTILAIGAAVSKPWKIGDRVCGMCHGANMLEHEDGAFAEVIAVKGDVCLRVPGGWGMEEASALGVGVVTTGLGLYQVGGLGLRLPSAEGGEKEGKEGKEGEGEYVLIYGGSTATGTMAIQFAKLSGYKVLTTCSPTHTPRLLSLGATATFNYADPDCGAQIREYTQNTLYHAFDCISTPSSIAICADALSSDPPTETNTKLRYISLLAPSPSFPRPDVLTKTILAYTALGEPLRFPGKGDVIPPTIAPRTEDFAFTAMFVGIAEKLLSEGKVRGHPVRVGEGGLSGVVGGLEELREGRVSGVKLVYRVGDT